MALLLHPISSVLVSKPVVGSYERNLESLQKNDLLLEGDK